MISFRTHPNEDHVCGGKRSKIRKPMLCKCIITNQSFGGHLGEIFRSKVQTHKCGYGVCVWVGEGSSRDTSHPPCELRSSHLECTESLPVCMLLVGALGKLGKNQFSAGHGVQGRRAASGTQKLQMLRKASSIISCPKVWFRVLG